MSFLRCARPLPLVSGTLAMILAVAAVASAQNPPLAEVARKEQERRKTLTAPSKVLTNKDLPAVTAPAPPPAAADTGKPETPAAQTPGEPPAQAAEQPKDPTKDEGWWRARITVVRDQLERDEVMRDALEVRVNGLNSTFVGGYDPYQRKLGEDRQKAIVELDRVRTEIADLKTKVDDIEEEARKAGAPPGWLR